MLGDGVPARGPDAPDTATPSANNRRRGAVGGRPTGHAYCPGRGRGPRPSAFIPGIGAVLAQFPRWRCSPGEKSAATDGRSAAVAVAGTPSRWCPRYRFAPPALHRP
ncbi:hypothetical protein KPATCC21470_4043 [Kitasatospora purpeofusca]